MLDKVGALTADRIARAIVAEGWPVGMHLGTELELMERFTVSRAGIREAIRILEYQGVVEMRRGRSGGLRVSAPDGSGIVASAVRYLTFRRVRPEHLLEARRIIELSLIPLVVDRMNNENARQLQQYLDHEEPEQPLSSPGNASKGFHTLLGALTGNPALKLFTHVLESLVHMRFYALHLNSAEAPEVHGFHVRVGEALIDRDLPRALAEFEKTLEHTKRYYLDVDEPS
ncbi:FadR/GntR family transcriptional regulator [Rhodococcus koreensis]|uniref:FadR/GntR family transcriptional regulator n=1 Tax=Rhodococcus koreensis TaxID=99653 RepID=UPI0036DA532F